MSKLTIKTRNEEYVVVAGIEFVPNFVRHIVKFETVSIFNESGGCIGGNAGVGESLVDWYVNHKDVDTNKIKNALLRECVRINFGVEKNG